MPIPTSEQYMVWLVQGEDSGHIISALTISDIGYCTSANKMKLCYISNTIYHGLSIITEPGDYIRLILCSYKLLDSFCDSDAMCCVRYTRTRMHHLNIV